MTMPTESFGVRRTRLAEDTEIPRFAILWSTSSISDGAAATPLTRAEVSKVSVVAPMVTPTWGFSKSVLRSHSSQNEVFLRGDCRISLQKGRFSFTTSMPLWPWDSQKFCTILQCCNPLSKVVQREQEAGPWFETLPRKISLLPAP
jgi:hypothetical protein